MGIHYVNLDLLGDGALTSPSPEAVLYEPQKDGSMKLMAVEYITREGPSAALGDSSQLHQPAKPLRPAAVLPSCMWGLDGQPMGEFSDMNPDASCTYAR